MIIRAGRGEHDMAFYVEGHGELKAGAKPPRSGGTASWREAGGVPFCELHHEERKCVCVWCVWEPYYGTT